MREKTKPTHCQCCVCSRFKPWYLFKLIIFFHPDYFYFWHIVTCTALEKSHILLGHQHFCPSLSVWTVKMWALLDVYNALGLEVCLAPRTVSDLKMLAVISWKKKQHVDMKNLTFYLNLRLSDHLLFLPPHSPDHQAFWHCHCAHAGQAPSPHHANHGLCAAAVPKESQRGENWPGKKLSCSFLAGISKADDCRELLTEFTGW